MIIEPKGAQKNVLALEAKGHTVVLGTAGSGKTTMVLFLAKKLSNLAGKPKVLVVTFNRALVAYMNDIQSAVQGITVEHYHRFARGNSKRCVFCLFGVVAYYIKSFFHAIRNHQFRDFLSGNT